MDEFAASVLTHVPALRRYARALAGGADGADDLVQDALERALSRRHLWRRPGNLRAWLFTILHNVHANHRRRLSNRMRPAPLEDAPEPAAAGSPFDDMAARETLRAFALLSEEHRQVLFLVAVEGMGYAEAADLLGVPLGTVMSRLSRARDKLRRLGEGELAPTPRIVR